VTPSEIEIATFRLVAQCLIQLRHRVPHTPSSAEIKERVELYLYSHSGPSWSILGWTLSLPLPLSEWRISAIFGVGDMAENEKCTFLQTTGKFFLGYKLSHSAIWQSSL